MAEPSPWQTLPVIGPGTRVERTGSGGWWVDGRPVPRPLLWEMGADELKAYERQLEEAAARTEGFERQEQRYVESSVAQGTPRREAEESAEGDLEFFQQYLVTTLGSVEDQLRASGADMTSPQVISFIRDMPDGAGDRNPEALAGAIARMAELYPSTDTTAYHQALEASGFEGDFVGGASALGDSDILSGRGTPRSEVVPGSAPNMESQDDWLRFKGGVLVDLSSGQVFFEPGSIVPGSPQWRMKVAANFSNEKASEWRQKLFELGYLSKEQAKVNGVDQPFLDAITAYHVSRYQNGGKVVPLDLTAGAGARDERAKLVDVREEMGSTVRNTIRETYRSIYGTDPTDGEVEAFSNTVFSTAMELQRKYRSKYGDPNTARAVQEAGERFTEKIEGSPGATLLRESDEENTRLRDALETAVVATRGLAG